MKYILIAVAFIVVACHRDTSRYSMMAIDKDGVVENFKVDQSKPKVISNYSSVKAFEELFWHGLSNDKIVKGKADYPQFEFVFYIRLTDSLQIEQAMQVVKQFQISTPIYLDIDKRYNDGMTYSLIVGADDKQYGVAVFGIDLSPFDQEMKRSISQIKNDKNGIN